MSDSNTAPEEFAERMSNPFGEMAADRSNYAENGDEQAVMVAYSQILTELEEVLPGIDMQTFRRMLSSAPGDGGCSRNVLDTHVERPVGGGGDMRLCRLGTVVRSDTDARRWSRRFQLDDRHDGGPVAPPLSGLCRYDDNVPVLDTSPNAPEIEAQ